MTSGGNRYPEKADRGAGRTGRCRSDLIARVSLMPTPVANATVPGLGPDQERAPRLPPKEPARGSQERLVGCTVDRSLHLPAQDRDLVSQHGDLQFRLSRNAVVRAGQAEDAAQEEIEEGANHGAALLQTGPPVPALRPAIEFLDPTG